MKNQNDNIIKLKVILLPFLTMLFSVILIYTSLRWLLDIKLQILHLKDFILDFVLPFIFAGLSVVLFFRKRIRILDLNTKRDHHFLYQFVFTALISIPLIILQTYIEKSSFDLISVSNISEINEHKRGKYFEIKEFDIAKNYSTLYQINRVTGKHNEDLTFYMYFSCPFQNVNNIWYGVEYSLRISNRDAEIEKDKAHQQFFDKTISNFENYNFQNVKYFERVWYSDDLDGYINAIKNNYTEFEKPIILKPINENFEDRLGNKIIWFFIFIVVAIIVSGLMIFLPPLSRYQYERLIVKRLPIKHDDLKEIINYLNPLGNNKAGAILVNINLLVFTIMILNGISFISPTGQELLDYGGNRRYEVINGDFWRLITSQFLHSGIMHLFMNIYGLVIGLFMLDKIIKPIKLIGVYLLAGIISGIASIYWYENTVSVGASGAIFGLYGIILTFTVLNKFPTAMKGFAWALLIFYAGLNLILGLFMQGIDNSAHIGGLVAGVLIGLILIVIEKNNINAS